MAIIAILCISDFENWNSNEFRCMGGASGVIKSILPYLNGDKIYLMGVTYNKSELYKEKKLSEKVSSYSIVHIPKGSRIPDRFWAFWYSRNINSIFLRLGVTSVYVHSEEMGYSIKPGYTVLYHMHGAVNALSKAKNKYLRNTLFQKLWERVQRKNLQTADKIIAIDLACFDIAKRVHKEKQTVLLPNYVDEDIFFNDGSFSELLRTVQDNILLFVGRFEEVKGLELFVETVRELNLPGRTKWTGVLVGHGTYKKNIDAYIEKISDVNFFHFTGPVFDQQDLRKIYSRANVLMVSSHHEGIPMVILESLACGTPVVSTNVGGVKSLIADAKMCFVLDERNPVLFAKKIVEVTSRSTFPEKEEFKFSARGASLTINRVLSK